MLRQLGRPAFGDRELRGLTPFLAICSHGNSLLAAAPRWSMYHWFTVREGDRPGRDREAQAPARCPPFASGTSREEEPVASEEIGVKPNRRTLQPIHGPGTVPVRLTLRNGSASRCLSFSGTEGPGSTGIGVPPGWNHIDDGEARTAHLYHDISRTRARLLSNVRPRPGSCPTWCTSRRGNPPALSIFTRSRSPRRRRGGMRIGGAVGLRVSVPGPRRHHTSVSRDAGVHAPIG